MAATTHQFAWNDQSDSYLALLMASFILHVLVMLLHFVVDCFYFYRFSCIYHVQRTAFVMYFQRLPAHFMNTMQADQVRNVLIRIVPFYYFARFHYNYDITKLLHSTSMKEEIYPCFSEILIIYRCRFFFLCLKPCLYFSS